MGLRRKGRFGMSARTRKARKLRRIGWQRGAARLRRSSDLDRARGALQGAIARPMSWLTADERKAWLDQANDRALAIARLIALCIVDDGDETGGGGGAPVSPDHMPATANPTPCGS